MASTAGLSAADKDAANFVVVGLREFRQLLVEFFLMRKIHGLVHPERWPAEAIWRYPTKATKLFVLLRLS